MPEYLAPGVYIEETSFRSKSIEGVSTTTAGFIGPTRYGPTDLDNQLITSLGDFKRIYGDGDQLNFAGNLTVHNYMWHAARAFFAEGGKRLYVSRIFLSNPALPDSATGGYRNGRARAELTDSASPPAGVLTLLARWPGQAGNMRVRIGVHVGQNILGFDEKPTLQSVSSPPTEPVPLRVARVSSLSENDVVMIRDPGDAPPTTLRSEFRRAERDSTTNAWRFKSDSPSSADLSLSDFQRASDPQNQKTIHVLTASVAVAPGDGLGSVEVWEGLALDSRHLRNGANDSLTYTFGQPLDNRDHGRELPLVIEAGSGPVSGLALLDLLFAAAPAVAATATTPASRSLREEVTDPASNDGKRGVERTLAGGNDGQLPSAKEYEGEAEPTSTSKTGLKQFEDIEDISMIAAPGSTYNYESGAPAQDRANAIAGLLLQHCTLMRYRIAIIDSGNSLTLNQVQAQRAQFDSSWGAFYYPWVRVLDPVTRVPIFLPPSGFVAGIYARNDITRAVYKAPANEVVNLAQGFESMLNKAQQDVVNPQGINCFRYFEGRGYRLWGSRTMSSDPEWKYVNIRRYFAYLEHSIDRGTQWAVFEPNGPSLWLNVRQTIEDFLLNEFYSGALLGDKPEKAYFVRCDRSTMSQNDLDNGRLICLIGVAPVKPAEFVIFRIGQWTADRK